MRTAAPEREYREWAGRAACRGMPSSVFFVAPEPGDRRYRTGSYRTGARERAAQAVCRSCPVLAQCAEYALRRPEVYGIWGGMTQRERGRIRSRRRATA